MFSICWGELKAAMTWRQLNVLMRPLFKADWYAPPSKRLMASHKFNSVVPCSANYTECNDVEQDTLLFIPQFGYSRVGSSSPLNIKPGNTSLWIHTFIRVNIHPPTVL